MTERWTRARALQCQTPSGGSPDFYGPAIPTGPAPLLASRSSRLAGVIFRVSAPPARRVKLLDSLSACLLATVRRSRVQHAMPERQTRAGTRR
ncbi:hypothetical protein [Kibdelosporangium philippinense]|uniref:hypothetical protein n=1 Tax=Kibdelosporangium philippinense TaxID=211113 RepID=UPI003611179E